MEIVIDETWYSCSCCFQKSKKANRVQKLIELPRRFKPIARGTTPKNTSAIFTVAPTEFWRNESRRHLLIKGRYLLDEMIRRGPGLQVQRIRRPSLLKTNIFRSFKATTCWTCSKVIDLPLAFAFFTSSSTLAHRSESSSNPIVSGWCRKMKLKYLLILVRRLFMRVIQFRLINALLLQTTQLCPLCCKF